MKKKLILLCTALVVLILEILPYGAVCNFANPEGEPFRVTYSYFSMIPYGYANFGPFITAILTCVLIVIIILSILLKKDWCKPISVISVIAVLTSLAPLLFGIENFSLVGAMITLTLAGLFAVSKINFK